MAFQLTVTDIKERYSEILLQRLTSKTDQINDNKISTAIKNAKVTLSCLISIDENVYGIECLEKWWSELTYYELFKNNEREIVARDKYDGVKEEIKSFKENRAEQLDSDYPNGYIITASSEILPEADILRWK